FSLQGEAHVLPALAFLIQNASPADGCGHSDPGSAIDGLFAAGRARGPIGIATGPATGGPSHRLFETPVRLPPFTATLQSRGITAADIWKLATHRFPDARWQNLCFDR